MSDWRYMTDAEMRDFIEKMDRTRRRMEYEKTGCGTILLKFFVALLIVLGFLFLAEREAAQDHWIGKIAEQVGLSYEPLMPWKKAGDE